MKTLVETGKVEIEVDKYFLFEKEKKGKKKMVDKFSKTQLHYADC